MIDISKPIFKSKLFKKVKEVFDKTKKSSFKKKKILLGVKKDREKFAKILKVWIKKNNL